MFVSSLSSLVWPPVGEGGQPYARCVFPLSNTSSGIERCVLAFCFFEISESDSRRVPIPTTKTATCSFCQVHARLRFQSSDVSRGMLSNSDSLNTRTPLLRTNSAVWVSIPLVKSLHLTNPFFVDARHVRPCSRLTKRTLSAETSSPKEADYDSSWSDIVGNHATAETSRGVLPSPQPPPFSHISHS